MANEAVIEFTKTPKNILPPYSFLECKKQLMCEFRNIYANDIGKVLKFHKGHYAESFTSLRLVMEKINNQLKNSENVIQASNSDGISLILKRADRKRSVTIKFHKMVRGRPCSNICTDSEDLRQEALQVKEQIQILEEDASRQFALSLLEDDYSKMGQLIECACCFGKCVFDNMAQCAEGHLVCVECLRSFINEIAFGSGKVVLSCMMPECTAEYPQSELTRCLDANIRSKLEERTLLENLNTAEIEDLVRCPYCDYAAILPREEIKFSCYRDTCGKVTCRNCGNDWEGHVGLSCSMVETRDETSLRKEYEERMTRAKVRTCTNCNMKFMKEAGCNRMACRCGMTMCYVCRTPRITYKHFCLHVNGSEKCTQCKACPLWTDTEDDDERAIQEIKKEAKMKRKALGYVGERDIGAPAVKKARFFFF